LLKSRRQVLHRRVAEVLLDNVGGAAPPEPELLAHHFTQAGLTEAAIQWWGKAGQRSLERSALVEAVEQISRALDQIANLPSTPTLRREEIKLQVALITPLIHVKGYAAPETKAASERARMLIEKAEALGERPEDPLLLFSVFYGLWVAKYVAFDGDALRELAAQFLTLAEKQGATVPLMIGHRLMGMSALHTGDFAQARVHYDKGVALYDPAEHRPLATRFGQDVRVAILSYRSWTLWILGYPDLGLGDADRALKDAREIGQAATLMYALNLASMFHIICRSFVPASARTRPGERRGGRQKGTPNKKTALTQAAIAARAANENLSPLDLMLAIMRDPRVALVTRVKMALRALPLLHTKLTAVPSGSSGLGHNGTAVPSSDGAKKSNSGSRKSAPATHGDAKAEAAPSADQPNDSHESSRTSTTNGDASAELGSGGAAAQSVDRPEESETNSRNSAPATNGEATTEAGAKHPDLMPLDFLLSVMRHPKTPATLRIKVALATQPYIHPRKSNRPTTPVAAAGDATVLKWSLRWRRSCAMKSPGWGSSNGDGTRDRRTRKPYRSCTKKSRRR
jgi:hypothetical protein